jgi:uncharacterized protein (DUF362 family)
LSKYLKAKPYTNKIRPYPKNKPITERQTKGQIYLKMTKETVIIRRCEDYDPVELEAIITEGMRDLNFTPKGKVMFKANEVAGFYKKRLFRYATTEPAFLNAALATMQNGWVNAQNVEEIFLGGNSGAKLPTRYALKTSGLWEILKKRKIKIKPFDEFGEVEVKLNNSRIYDKIKIPTPLYEADTLICLPRLKANLFTGITASIKMNVGMLLEHERLKFHDYRLDETIVDLLEIGNYDFIAADAIIGGEGNMIDPDPHKIGAIVMGTNPVAVDSILARGVGLSPRDVGHIRVANERGYGPIKLEEISLKGDMSLGEFKERAEGFKIDDEKLDKLITNNPNSKLKLYVGSCCSKRPNIYCQGGCMGSLKLAIDIGMRIKPNMLDNLKPMHIVVGHYRGDIKTNEREPILFIGKDKTYCGNINNNYVEFNTSEKIRDIRNKSNYKKMYTMKQCPPSMIDTTMQLSRLGGVTRVGSPVFNPKNMLGAFPLIRDCLVREIMYQWNTKMY